MNAINATMIQALVAALRGAMMDPAVRVIVLTGAGTRAFCAGDDLIENDPSALPEATLRGLIETLQDVSRVILTGDKPVIGAINGWAVGGGFEWALNCDFTIWAASARAFFPELRWGMFTTGAVTALLPAMVGLPKAREMLMLGETYDAPALAALGIATQVVQDAELVLATETLAGRLAALPEAGLTRMKHQLNRIAVPTLESVLAAETEATLRGMMDPETARRIASYSTKKP
jgi:enoyl-CoA hydratase/carnithine racemase